MGNTTVRVRMLLQLIRRDFRVIFSRVGGLMLDNIVILLVNVFLFGYLMPRMGMLPELIGPIFIGTVMMSFFQIGFSLATGIVQDIKFSRFIEYHLTLPLTIRWLLAAYIIRFVIEIMLVTLPVLLAGMLLLGRKFVIIHTSWPGFALIYLLTTVFFATLFLLFSFALDYDWFWANIWTRRIEPLFLFGAIMIVWKKLYAFSAFWGIVFLCNPVTYAVEGMRAALIGGDLFLPLWLCILCVSVALGVTLYFLGICARKALDHV